MEKKGFEATKILINNLPYHSMTPWAILLILPLLLSFYQNKYHV